MVAVRKILTDPSFRSSSAEFFPNRLVGNGKVGALVVVKGKHDDFGLGVAGLEYVVKAEAEGRIKEGYVVLAKPNGGTTLEYVASARAGEVAKRLHNVTPRIGPRGAYHWVTAKFEAAASNGKAGGRSPRRDEKPF